MGGDRYSWPSLLAFHCAQPKPRSLRVSSERYRGIVGAALAPSIGAWRGASMRHGWADRLAEYDARSAERSIDAHLDAVLESERAHAVLGQRMTDLSADALALLAEKPERLTVDEARLLGIEGAKLSRLVAGNSTSREEIAVAFASATGEAVVTVFVRAIRAGMAASALPWDSAMAAACRDEFGRGLDALLREQFTTLGLPHPEAQPADPVDPMDDRFAPVYADPASYRELPGAALQ